MTEIRIDFSGWYHDVLSEIKFPAVWSEKSDDISCKRNATTCLAKAKGILMTEFGWKNSRKSGLDGMSLETVLGEGKKCQQVQIQVTTPVMRVFKVPSPCYCMKMERCLVPWPRRWLCFEEWGVFFPRLENKATLFHFFGDASAPFKRTAAFRITTLSAEKKRKFSKLPSLNFQNGTAGSPAAAPACVSSIARQCVAISGTGPGGSYEWCPRGRVLPSGTVNV